MFSSAATRLPSSTYTSNHDMRSRFLWTPSIFPLFPSDLGFSSSRSSWAGGSPLSQHKHSHFLDLDHLERLDNHSSILQPSPEICSPLALVGKKTFRPTYPSILDESHNKNVPLPGVVGPEALLMFQEVDRAHHHVSCPARRTTTVVRSHRVCINVSGALFETQYSTLERYPNTLLGCPTKRQRFWDAKRNEFFFDRHRQSFGAILNFYQSGGRLIKPNDIPTDVFYDELLFFDLGQEVLSRFLLENGFVDIRLPGKLPQSCFSTCWKLLEYPNSGWAARSTSIFSMSIIVILTVAYCMETLPDYKSKLCMDIKTMNGNEISKVNHYNTFYLIEVVCMIFVTIEFLLRILTTPLSKREYFSSSNSILDLIILFTYLLYIFLLEVSNDCVGKYKESWNYILLHLCRFIRVLRVFKLAKYITWLQVIAETLRQSIREICTFVCFMSICVTLFATLVYLAERFNDQATFSSIPDAFWWAIISMTTVGYGDSVPKGWAGKLVGSVCVVAAVFTVALPVPIMVANFNAVYQRYQLRTSIEERGYQKDSENSPTSPDSIAKNDPIANRILMAASRNSAIHKGGLGVGLGSYVTRKNLGQPYT